MRSCFYIPRMFVPRKERTDWCVIAGNRYVNRTDFWENLPNRSVPSAYKLMIPEAYFADLDEERVAELHEEMYTALERDYLEKLLRGFILTERSTKKSVRHGIVAAFDLEAFSAEPGEKAMIRPVQEHSFVTSQAYLEQRRGAPVEMPHVIICYQDPKDRIMKALLKEDLEELYSYCIEGGTLKGFFLPEELAEEAAEAMQTKADPCLGVLEGIDCVVAAKEYWEELKPTLLDEEKRRHPARFMLAEFVNLWDDELELKCVHRLIKGVSPAEFTAYFKSKFKCDVKENVITLQAAATPANVGEAERCIKDYCERSGASCCGVAGAKRLKQFVLEESDCAAGVLFRDIAKEDIVKILKNGGVYPHRSLCVGGVNGGRYCIEIREISYD